MEKASAALQNVEGGGELMTKLKDLFGSATDSLKGVTDKASAEAAASKLDVLSGSVDGILAMIGKLPEEARTAVRGLVTEGMGGLRAMAEKVLAMPEVKDSLQPALDKLMEKLKGISGSE
jgi:hypothetical protein